MLRAQVFRASTGYTSDVSSPSEDAFLEAWTKAPDAAQGSITETLISYVKNSLFSHRRTK